MGKHKKGEKKQEPKVFKGEAGAGIEPPQQTGPQGSKPLDLDQALAKLERKLNTTGSLANQIGDNMEEAINIFIAIVSHYERELKLRDTVNGEMVTKIKAQQERINTFTAILTSHKIEIPPVPEEKPVETKTP